jgi:hypothetical protein
MKNRGAVVGRTVLRESPDLERRLRMTGWKFLHIASMFAAVSIFVGQGMLSGVVARTGDVRAMRRILAAEDRFGPIGGGIFLLGLVFGFVTAIVGDVDLTQPWLLIAYGLVAYILLTARRTRLPRRRPSSRLPSRRAGTRRRPSSSVPWPAPRWGTWSTRSTVLRGCASSSSWSRNRSVEAQHGAVIRGKESRGS